MLKLADEPDEGGSSGERLPITSYRGHRDPRRTGLSILRHWQVALLLIQKRVESLVVRRGQAKDLEERAVTAACFLQPTIDERREFAACQLMGPERL